jgi:uncharacterized repeat protein (TIGR01451 family)
LRFANAGPGSARGVVLRDSIPLSVTISRVTSSTVGSGVRITQTSAGPNFAWTVSDLAAGAGGVITLTGTLSPSVALRGTQFTNTATITASNDITATNNSSSARVALFNLTSHSPVTHAVGVAVTANITAGFDANLNAATVTTRTFTVRSNFRGLYTDIATVSGSGLTRNPSRDFFAGEQVQVVGTANVRSTGGAPLRPTQWGFTAGPIKPRCFDGFVDSGPADDALIGVETSSVAWGDYDNDGDLDILLTGNAGNSNLVAKVYRNDGGVFVAIDAAFTGVSYSSVAWGDYDNDGDLDILLTGATGSPVTRLYRNEECADLTLVKAVIPARTTPGGAITYTLSFSNGGQATASGVVISDSVPVSVTITGVTSSTFGSGVIITQTGAAPDFAWAVSDLAGGAGGVITLTGTLSNSVALIGTQITNTATITAEDDSTAGNNRATATVTITDDDGVATANNYLPLILKPGPPASAEAVGETMGSDGIPGLPEPNQSPAPEPGEEPVGTNRMFLPLVGR